MSQDSQQPFYDRDKNKSGNNNNNDNSNNNNITTTQYENGRSSRDVSILDSVKELENYGYSIGKKLNSGSFSRVHIAKHNDINCAVKVINLTRATANFIYKLLPREIVILKKLKHPNIIVLHDIILIQQSLYIFMELADGGDLLDHIVAQGALEESKAREWFQQICDALSYCHKLGVAHRDIKCENLLINQGSMKLTDFGFACIIYDTQTRRKLMSTTYCGSVSYVPPEILLNIPYDPTQSDIWSLGIVLYVMLNNQLPFESSNLTEIVKSQINKKWSFAANKVNIISKDLKELIKTMLDPNPSTRPNIATVMKAKWLKEATSPMNLTSEISDTKEGDDDNDNDDDDDDNDDDDDDDDDEDDENNEDDNDDSSGFSVSSKDSGNERKKQVKVKRKTGEKKAHRRQSKSKRKSGRRKSTQDGPASLETIGQRIETQQIEENTSKVAPSVVGQDTRSQESFIVRKESPQTDNSSVETQISKESSASSNDE